MFAQYFIRLTIGLLFLLNTMTAHAENNKTVGVTYYQMSYGQSGISALKSTMLGIQGNYRVFNGFSIEGRLAHGLDGSTFTDGDDITEVDISLLAGGYIKYSALHETSFSPYLIAGFTYTEIEINETQKEGTLTLDNNAFGDTSASYGIGLNYQINSKLLVGLEYINYYSNSNVNIDATGLNISYQF